MYLLLSKCQPIAAYPIVHVIKYIHYIVLYTMTKCIFDDYFNMAAYEVILYSIQDTRMMSTAE